MRRLVGLLAATGATLRSGPLACAALGRSSYPGAKITPELEPTSHKKFFDHDYPDDGRAVKPPHDWQHPYPILQDSEDYDKDYVKDENTDGGEWKVQETYDTLRGKLARQQALLRTAMEKERAVANKVHEAKMKEENARQRVEKALASERATKAESDSKRLSAGEGKGAVTDLGSHVEAQVANLQACQKRLEEARAHLKALQDERKKAEHELKEAADAKAAADQDQAAKEKEDAELQETVKELTSSHAKALEKYEEQDATLTKMEMGLREARSNLHTLRHMYQVDKEGGVYYNGMGVTTTTTPEPPPPSEPLHKRVWPAPSAASPSGVPTPWLAALAAALAVVSVAM